MPRRKAISYKELRVTGSLGQRRKSWEKALQLVGEHQVLLKPMVSHTLPLIRWEEGFRLYTEKSGLKILLIPD